MPKKFLVNGRNVWVEEADFDDVCEMFKENVTLDDLEKWDSEKDMEQYTATTFINKARYYFSLSPPDIVQSAEKTWFAAVCAVKELYLTGGGTDLMSHNSLSYFCDFAIDNSEAPFERRRFLRSCWSKAEKMHQDVCGSGNFSTNEYTQIISDIETFVLEFSKMDRANLYTEFRKTFIATNIPKVDVRKASGSIKLGGYIFKRNYTVFV